MKQIIQKFAMCLATGFIVLSFFGNASAQDKFGSSLNENTYKRYRLNVIHDVAMQEEMGLTSEQLQPLLKSYQEKTLRLQADLALERQKYTDDKLADYHEFCEAQRNAVYDELTVELSNALLPFQKQRLDQLVFWTVIERGGGIINVLKSDLVVKMLDIDEKQASKLNEKLSELDGEFKKELADLKSKYRDKMIELLDPNQQKKLKEMMGDQIPSKDE